ncbi:hypothetical protein P872_14320 [Rhodonellum psychrophilum GCM71 = DSM 17998]|uniref:Uncharacterized protein n=1 Tax=Rhodonellum psychrophilum GCM71 = DSM 17998 TaxID=1123057 RepID=U5BRP4_9BACT|nr:hypothetical protein P872_14320 [Rhodonellum psychrophilum GCM71 = DSM 17998]
MSRAFVFRSAFDLLGYHLVSSSNQDDILAAFLFQIKRDSNAHIVPAVSKIQISGIDQI